MNTTSGPFPERCTNEANMEIRLKSSSRYAQIADILRQRIARGVLATGDKLPTNEELAESFKVSRVTIRQAVNLLVQEGVVGARQGVGTFVTDTVPDNRWLNVETSLTDLSKFYKDTSPQLLQLSELVAPAPLRPEDGTPAPKYVFMRRVHSTAGRPYCVTSIYLDERIFSLQPDEFRTKTVIPLMLENKDIIIADAHQTLTIAAADGDTAMYLGVSPNSPVAEVRRIFKDPNGTIIYLSEVTYRGDFIRLEMDLNK